VSLSSSARLRSDARCPAGSAASGEAGRVGLRLRGASSLVNVLRRHCNQIPGSPRAPSDEGREVTFARCSRSPLTAPGDEKQVVDESRGWIVLLQRSSASRYSATGFRSRRAIFAHLVMIVTACVTRTDIRQQRLRLLGLPQRRQQSFGSAVRSPRSFPIARWPIPVRLRTEISSAIRLKACATRRARRHLRARSALSIAASKRSARRSAVEGLLKLRITTRRDAGNEGAQYRHRDGQEPAELQPPVQRPLYSSALYVDRASDQACEILVNAFAGCGQPRQSSADREYRRR